MVLSQLAKLELSQVQTTLGDLVTSNGKIEFTNSPTQLSRGFLAIIMENLGIGKAAIMIIGLSKMVFPNLVLVISFRLLSVQEKIYSIIITILLKTRQRRHCISISQL